MCVYVCVCVMSSIRLLGWDTLWVCRRLLVFGAVGGGLVWGGRRVLRREGFSTVLSREGSDVVEDVEGKGSVQVEECDCKPLWECMNDPALGECEELEKELRSCMARIKAKGV